jgi:hypothetical protein
MTLEKDLLEAVRSAVGSDIGALSERWEPCDWSRTVEIHLSTDLRIFLKGTPRGCPEAKVAERPNRCSPDAVPLVLHGDLLPDASWCWFLLEGAGRCSHEALTPNTATEAALVLGTLQRSVCQDHVLPAWLPHCEAQGLQDLALQICDWALAPAQGERRAQLVDLGTEIKQAEAFFRDAGSALVRFPATCVHGDFWAGNIANRDDAVWHRFPGVHRSIV